MRYASLILLSAGLQLGAAPRWSFEPSFEPNVGQADRNVRFVAHSGGHVAYITNAGIEMAGAALEFRGGKCAKTFGVEPLSERHNYFAALHWSARYLPIFLPSRGFAASGFIPASTPNSIAMARTSNTI